MEELYNLLLDYGDFITYQEYLLRYIKYNDKVIFIYVGNIHVYKYYKNIIYKILNNSFSEYSIIMNILEKRKKEYINTINIAANTLLLIKNS